MLKKQNVFHSYLTRAGEILAPARDRLPSQLTHRLDALRAEVGDARLLVPMIGAFSAGKSSLLNVFMGLPILPEGLRPETELATELHYASEGRVEAIDHEGQSHTFCLEELAEINKRSDQYVQLKVHVPAPALARIAPLILVDMPGFNSSIEAHNRAIDMYLPLALHYLSVVSVEEGTITSSFVRQIETVESAGALNTFILSKTNLRSPAQVDQIEDHLTATLDGALERAIHWHRAGAEDAACVEAALANADPEHYFALRYLPTIRAMHDELCAQLDSAIEALDMDQGLARAQLDALIRQTDELRSRYEERARRVRTEFGGPLKEATSRALRHSLEASVEELVEYLVRRDGDGFRRAIGDICRQALVKTLRTNGPRIAVQMSHDLIRELDLLPHVPGSAVPAKADVDALAAKLTQAARALVPLFARVKDEETGKAEQDKGKRKGKGENKGEDKGVPARQGTGDGKPGAPMPMLRTLLAGAELIGGVDPVVAAVAIFLPEIINGLYSLGERGRMRDQLRSQTIPGILRDAEAKFPEAIDAQMAQMLETIEAACQEELDAHAEILGAATSNADAGVAEHAAMRKTIMDGRAALQALAAECLENDLVD